MSDFLWYAKRHAAQVLQEVKNLYHCECHRTSQQANARFGTQ